jgi:glutamate 5-kinase
VKKIRSRWIVKAGSNMICSGGPMLIRAWMQQVSQLRKKHGVEVVWVTSGAIATAVDFLDGRSGFPARIGAGKRTLSEKQALSAIGQPLILDLYTLGLRTQGLGAAQVLLTYEDLADAVRRGNFQNTIEQLLEWQVTPILNENDAVATQEIRFGDNDSLSARVAKTIGADRLVILTDVEGLYDSDPRKNPSARLVTELASVPPKLVKQLGSGSGAKGGTTRGTGGMYSKVLAAKMASDAGIETCLVKGDEPNVLVELAEGAPIGTRILGRGRRGSKRGRR